MSSRSTWPPARRARRVRGKAVSRRSLDEVTTRRRAAEIALCSEHEHEYRGEAAAEFVWEYPRFGKHARHSTDSRHVPLRRAAWTVSIGHVLVLKVETEIPLAEPNEHFGFVTRLAVTVRAFDSPTSAPIGTAEIAVIHCADALNKGVSISVVMDEDSEELTTLCGVFFDDDSLKEEYSNGVGLDVLYVETLELHPDWRGRRIEEAVVRRVFDVWGTGCAIGVMALASPDESSRWEALGFELVEDAEGTTSASLFVFMDLSLRQPMVVEADAPEHSFQVVEAPRLEFRVDADDFERDQ